MPSNDTTALAPAASGGLDQISLPGFLYALFKRDATGELRVLHAGGQMDVVYVRDGFPVFVTNDRVTVDVLGGILVELGLIDTAQLNRSLELLARGGARHGELLVQMGALAPEGLRYGLTVQLRRKLNRLFYVQKGRLEWFFKDHELAAEVHAHPFQVILQAVRSAFGPDRLKAVDERLRGKMVRLLGGFAPYEPLYEFEEEELEAVRRLGSWTTLEGFLGGSGLGEQRARALLHSLDLTEVLDVRDVDEAVAGVAAAGAARPRTGGSPTPPRGAEPPPRAVAAAPALCATSSPAASPAGPQTPAPSVQARAIREKLEAKQARLAGASHFDVLEIPLDASTAQVQEAYRAMAKQFHPDRMPREVLGEMRAKVEEVFQRITEAYKVLADEKERSAYRALLASGGPKEKVDATSLLQAEQLFHKGEVALKRGAFVQAEKEFAEAAKLHQGELEYQAAEAWARWRAGATGEASARLRREALGMVSRAVKERGESERLEFWLAELLEADGKMDTALPHYRKVVALNRHHVDAKRKIHLHERKREEARERGGGEDGEKKKGGGLLSGLFKKK